MKSISLWRYCVFCKNILFCQNFRIDYTIHHQWRMKKREREREVIKGEKEREGTKRNQDVKEEAMRKREPKKGRPRPLT